MAKSVTIEIPHELGAEQARARISSGLEKIRGRYGQYVTLADENWSGNSAEVTASALGKSVTGTVIARDSVVAISFELPLIMLVFESQVREYLSKEASRYFAKK